MPFALPAAATALAAAAPAAAAAATSATLTSTLVSVASQVALNAAVSAVMSALSPQTGAAGRPVEWTLNPDGPIPFAFGRVGVAGSVVHKRTFGPDKMYYGFVSVLSGAGPIAGFDGFTGDDVPVSFDGNGKAVTSEWANEMWRVTRLGHQPDTPLTTPTGLKNNAQLPGWGGGYGLSGKACTMLVMGENSKRTAYPNGEVKPLEVIRGIHCWDPRLDSTWPGGVGPCRLNDPATWVWSENPMIFALRWALGLWEGPNGKGAPHVDQQVGGIGAKLSGIDVPALLAAANVADANGWTCAAYPSTDDDKHQVLVGFMQAAGATYIQRAGKISCIQRAAPRASVATITANDVVGALEIDTAASRIDRINTIRPRYWSPAHRWQMTAIDEVTAEAYRVDDGGKRTRGIDYPFVTNPVQAAQLAALDIANTREGIAGIVPLKPHLQRIRPGDAFTISEPGFVLDGVKCLCLNTDYDPATGIVSVTFVSETDAKYPFALGQSPDVPVPPVLTPRDPTVRGPDPNDWEIVIRPPAPGGGGQIPGFDLTGVVNNATAARVLVETGPTDDGPWTQAYLGPPTAERIQILVDPNTTYFIAVSYFNAAGVQSARTVYGPYTTGEVVGGGLTPTARDALVRDLEELLDQTDAAERLAETIIQTILDEQESYEREAERRLAAETGVLNEATIRIEDGIAETMNLVYTRAQTDAGLASTLQVARSYTDTYKSEAELLFSTKVERATGDAIAVLQAKAYTDDVESRASLTFVTQATYGSGLATTLSSAQSYTNGQVATALNTVYTRAQVDEAVATTLQQARSHTDTLRSDASLLYATQSSLNGVSATASLGLSTAVAANGVARATLGLALDVNGYISGFQSVNNGTTAGFYILADAFGIFAPAGGARTEYAGGIWYAFPADNAVRTMWGKSFGGGQGLVWWTGPNSVPIGSETKSNAYVYISTNTFGGPRFGGSDVGGGTAPLQAVTSNEIAVGQSAPGGGPASTGAVTITVSGAGSAGATVRWIKTEEYPPGAGIIANVSPDGRSASFSGTVGPGQLSRAIYLAVVVANGVSVTVIQDVQLTDPN